MADLIFKTSTEETNLVTYTNKSIDRIPQLKHLDNNTINGLHLAAKVFPFKVNNYVLENLIDWSSAPNDEIYRLLFPHPEMLTDSAMQRVQSLDHIKDKQAYRKEVIAIRDEMNPQPDGQQMNRPNHAQDILDGVQHKYAETVLFFPKQGQTCHSYCTFCFRWPQFVETSAHRFEARETTMLERYLEANQHISDVLITGGDPLVMSIRRLKNILTTFLNPSLNHVRNIRIGTKSLTYWPYRFISEEDSRELLALFEDLSNQGKHVAIMSHINHWREMQPKPFSEAVRLIRDTGATIRSQAPVLRHVNDDPKIWKRLWEDQVSLGIMPYYMFIERDTGAQHYFSLPLLHAHHIYKEAIKSVSGLARTARGPVMSASPGKIQILGELNTGNEKAIALTMLQGRNSNCVHSPFLAKHSTTATWIDDLEPFQGTEFPFK
ncbi:lysine 2,3-aminomutase [Chromohalobacter salexigens]|uniref:KamA family radical SAM protein n=1 Tax=Chromohalobacter israelensis TaxID=141390 RepID=UPI0032E84F5B